MDKILDVIKPAVDSDTHDDDLSDRLNSRYTVMFLLAFTVVVSTQLYVGTPINCWCPKEFEDSWIKYTNSYCWVKNTYYLPLEDDIPKVGTQERERREILYYQWLPFLMIVQAVMFYMPSLVWHSFNQRAGVDCDSVLDSAVKYQTSSTDAGNSKLLNVITNHIDRMMLADDEEVVPPSTMKIRNFLRKVLCGFCNTNGRYLILLYLFTKLLYLSNVIVQLVILNRILRADYALYGYELVANALNDRHWVNSDSFPRVTMCDFSVRRLGNNHRYTVQCVLPINMYTEKIYAFLWVWLLFVAVATFLSLVQWMLRIIFAEDKYRYVLGHMKYREDFLDDVTGDRTQQYHEVHRFVDESLRPDGVFMLRLIGHNTNNLTVTDIIIAMWENWVARKKKKDDDFNTQPKVPLPQSLDESEGGKAAEAEK